ncbi:MAG TPA: HPF/RaiA family ribosome-associated protein [Methylomirabilota bacterium]|jgi:ribosome-associated translation inhibitor RaiA|nr:HPF/RaiA family ribosome-associated protein [Methylomirabilota bacterium]
MTIAIEGAQGHPALRALVARRMESLTGRLRTRPMSARVAFTDENGPKGGVDTRCVLTLALPRRPPLSVEQVAESHRLAFDGALASLERRLSRELGQARGQRRRPKKYYVARRLLLSRVEPGPGQ